MLPLFSTRQRATTNKTIIVFQIAMKFSHPAAYSIRLEGMRKTSVGDSLSPS
jgi:hypothetical protein